MTLSLSVSPEAEAKLRARAESIGQPLDVYASRVLEDAAAAPTIDEVLAPVRQQVAQSGASEGELMNLGRELLSKVRDERKGGR